MDNMVHHEIKSHIPPQNMLVSSSSNNINTIETSINNILIEKKIATFQECSKQTKGAGLATCLSNMMKQKRIRDISPKQKKKILNSRLKSSAMINSYTNRINHLIAKNKITQPHDDKSLSITVILVNEETADMHGH